MSGAPRRLSSALGPARRVVATPEKKKKKKKPKKELPEWTFSVSDLDSLKISREEQERRKASMVSKHAEEAKEELERRLVQSSRNPRASLKALEKLAPEEDPCVRLSVPSPPQTGVPLRLNGVWVCAPITAQDQAQVAGRKVQPRRPGPRGPGRLGRGGRDRRRR
jgi:hypothetical protein